MLNPDFSRYSLALFSDGRIMFVSENPGLRPLFECVRTCRGRLQDCELHDRVTGLAAAMLIVFSGMISKVRTGVASRAAHDLLQASGIGIEAGKTVDRILTRDGKSRCPMETRALATKDPALFYRELESLFKAK